MTIKAVKDARTIELRALFDTLLVLEAIIVHNLRTPLGELTQTITEEALSAIIESGDGLQLDSDIPGFLTLKVVKNEETKPSPATPDDTSSGSPDRAA